MSIEIVSKALLSELIKRGVNTLAKNLVTTPERVKLDENILELRLDQHINTVNNWSGEVSFQGLKKPKPIHQIYHALKISDNPRKNKYSEDEPESTTTATELLITNKNAIIFGDPGAGKTTTVKYMCQHLFTATNETNRNFPLLIRLTDLTPEMTIYWHLSQILGIEVTFPSDRGQKEFLKHLVSRTVTSYLNELQPVIFLEGFDEISHSGLDEILGEIRDLFLCATHYTVILTCRSGEFNYTLDNSISLEILPLSHKQIYELASNWINDDLKVKQFVDELKDAPYFDTVKRPLILGQLCAIFERTGQLPEKPKTIYRKVVMLLLEDWDEQWKNIRKSKYGNFDKERKLDFLEKFAFELTLKYRSNLYDKTQFEEIYEEIREKFTLPKGEMKQVIQEIESHTGLITKASTEKFEFAHLSLKEYLVASYIVKLPPTFDFDYKIKHLNHEFAIAVSLSTEPSGFLAYILFDMLKIHEAGYPEIEALFRRLIIEKVDFNIDKRMGIAILILLNNQFYKGNILELFVTSSTKIRDSLKLALELFEEVSRKDKYILYIFNDSVVLDRNIKMPKELRIPNWI